MTHSNSYYLQFFLKLYMSDFTTIGPCDKRNHFGTLVTQKNVQPATIFIILLIHTFRNFSSGIFALSSHEVINGL